VNKRANCDKRFLLLMAPVLFVSLLSPPLVVGQQTADEPALTPEIEAHWQAAQDAQNRKDYKTAAREYRAVIVSSPRFAEAYQNLGLAYQLGERWPDAMQAFGKALALRPSLTGANLFLGIDYCQEGESRRAIPYLTKVTVEKPDLPEAWSWLATAQEMQNDIAAEIITLHQALQIHPENIDLLYLLGHETFAATEKGGMGPVTEGLFAFLSRNAKNATDQFNIPPEQVIELGARIDL